ncbi:MAG: hypothetical protein VKS61_00730 [Candidatus Sericytochromatia bacterium]|nr:hypothetical protein [Candidatus Sericytochromatia bacterium]
MPPRPRALLSLVACLLVGCTAASGVAPPRATGGRAPVRGAGPKASVPPDAGAPAGPPTTTSPAGPLSSEGPLAAPRGALVGRVQLPASLLTANGGRVASTSGGGLVSDQGGSLLANNGATLISDQGGSAVSPYGSTLISDQGGRAVSHDGSGVVSSRGGVSSSGGRYALRQAVATGPGGDVVAIANAQVGLFDAAGVAVKDASGAPLVTTTDAEGRYAFPTAPTDRAVVAVCQLAGTAGQAAALVPKARGQADLDVASSVMASYVISKFARTQADPQAALERLPAGLEAQARAATAAALATGSGPARLEAAAAVQAVETLRGKAGVVDQLYEKVRRAMVVAGQANLGEGQPALTAEVWLMGARRLSAGGWWLLDDAAARVWEVVDGRLRVLAGSGVRDGRRLVDGGLAREASLGELVAMHEGPEGRPWILQSTRAGGSDDVTGDLFRLEPDGRVTILATTLRPWRSREQWEMIDFLPLGPAQALVVSTDRVEAVGGAPEHPLWPQGGAEGPFEIVGADRRPDGTIRVAASHYLNGRGVWRLWRLRAGLLPEPLPAPSGAHWYGFDDAGNLVASTQEGGLEFHPPGGGAPHRIGAEALAAWPPALRPQPGGIEVADLRFGGDGRTAGWVRARGRLATFGPDGALSHVVAGPAGAPPPQEGPTALNSPAMAAMDAAGTVHLIDGDDTLVRIVNRRAEPVSAPGFQGWGELRLVPGDPFAFTVEVLDEDDVVVKELPRFGAGYAVPAREAHFLGPAALRVAPDGSVWVLDLGDSRRVGDALGGRGRRVEDAFVRRVADGFLETVAVKSSLDLAPWIDMAPTAEGAAVVLSSGEDHAKLLRVKGTEPPTELVRVPYAVPPEACEACQHDGMAPLPGGAWLLRVQGVLWRWAPGQAPVRLGVDGVATADTLSPSALMAASADGKVAVADEQRVYRLDLATGKATAVAGAGTANLAGSTPDTGLTAVTGLAVAPNGDLLITDGGARQVKLVPAAAW